jgi:putative phosphoesterase
MPELVRVGVLADTHMPGSLRAIWPEVADLFAEVDLILHAGDICGSSVLDELEQWAPVLAARGNNDYGLEGDTRVADVVHLDIHGVRVTMIHDMEPEHEPIDVLRDKFLGGVECDVMITGHTHFERIDYREGVLQLNPGSAVHPHLWSTRLGTAAILEIGPGHLTARTVHLGHTPDLRNPTVEQVFDGTAVVRVD